MASFPSLLVAPALSTSETHIFEDPTPDASAADTPRLTEDELLARYEVARTIKEIQEGGWRRIGLQFPDHMVGDGVRVYSLLKQGLQRGGAQFLKNEIGSDSAHEQELGKCMSRVGLDDSKSLGSEHEHDHKLCILADTSYGSCCVDEIAAEHVDAEVVVHYGRSCLSPTARLPVIYVFTTQKLELNSVVQAFMNTYEDRSTKVLLVADLPYQNHLHELAEQLRQDQYTNLFIPETVHSPAALIPNRSLPAHVDADPELLKEYAVFHLGQPPPALLLTLASRVSSIYVYGGDSDPRAIRAVTTPTLRRRYALLTALSTVPIFGILINTLSVKNYLHVVTHVQKLISAAGKKSYTFVVGKVNPAKVANFAEIGGWVVIGCWESSLVDSRDFYKPLITPFELELALTDDKDRLWNGDWRSDFDAMLDKRVLLNVPHDEEREAEIDKSEEDEDDDNDESAPPEFDLRTGRYISHSRPMRINNKAISSAKPDEGVATSATKALTRRANGNLAQVGGIASPGAEYLLSSRSWKGLGSDYEIKYDENDTQMEEGRSGVAKGYAVGEEIEGSHG